MLMPHHTHSHAQRDSRIRARTHTYAFRYCVFLRTLVVHTSYTLARTHTQTHAHASTHTDTTYAGPTCIMHARTNTRTPILLFFFFFVFFSPMSQIYHTLSHTPTLYTRILLSLFTLVPHHTHSHRSACSRAHTHTLVLLSFICQRWCHNTHTHTHSHLVLRIRNSRTHAVYVTGGRARFQCQHAGLPLSTSGKTERYVVHDCRHELVYLRTRHCLVSSLIP